MVWDWSDRTFRATMKNRLETSPDDDVYCTVDPDAITHSGWKIHVYGNSVDDVIDAMKRIGDYLEQNGFVYKMGTNQRFAPSTSPAQRVKAVTIYIPNAARLPQIAQDLLSLMRGYQANGPMRGDKRLGNGLYYRYEFSRPVAGPVGFNTYQALYSRASVNYNIPGNPDPLLAATPAGWGAAPATGAVIVKGQYQSPVYKFKQPLMVLKMKGRIWEFAIITIIGFLISTNFWDNFWFTGVALILWGFYIILPDQMDILNAAAAEFETRIGPNASYASTEFQDILRSKAWPLWLKCMLKLIIVMLIAVQFSIFSATLPMANFITLIILFTLYFTMPTTYRPDQPWKAVEAWFRFLLGVTIAAFMWALFTGHTAQVLDPLYIFTLQMPIVAQAMADALMAIMTAFGAGMSVNVLGTQLAGSPAALFFLLGLAFFATFPVELEAA